MRSWRLLSVRYLGRHRVRTIISVLAVALGVAMILAGDLIGDAIYDGMTQSVELAVLTAGLSEQLVIYLTSAGVAITFVAGFLIFNAFAMSITQRQREIGLLRSVGMTRRQIMESVLLEGLVTGGLGTLVGLVGGPLLGRGIINLLRKLIHDIVPFGESSINWTLYLFAGFVGLGVSLASVLIPSYRAALVAPLAATQTPSAFGIEIDDARRAKFGFGLISLLVILLIAATPGKWAMPPWNGILTGIFMVVWLFSLALILSTIIGGVGHWGRMLLRGMGSTVGRLIADNFRRGRRRVTLTIATLAISLALIVSMTGFINFFYGQFFEAALEVPAKMGAWNIFTFDITTGAANYIIPSSISIPPSLIDEVREVAAGRAEVVEMRFTIVPELSLLGDSFFSYVMDPHQLKRLGDTYFKFTAGDWETALPVMEAGCSVLITPAVASKNHFWLGDTFEVTVKDGVEDCIVAGIGQSYGGPSIISAAVRDKLEATGSILLTVIPLPGVERDLLEADLAAIALLNHDVFLTEVSVMVENQAEIADAVISMMNAMLLLAILAAALGVINTTMMSVAERRKELALLRSIGATKRQLIAVVVGEAALMGVISAVMGLIAGVGVIVVMATVFGGNSFGAIDLDLWSAAWSAILPSLANGLMGLIAAPLIAAGAALLPVWKFVRGRRVITISNER